MKIRVGSSVYQLMGLWVIYSPDLGYYCGEFDDKAQYVSDVKEALVIPGREKIDYELVGEERWMKLCVELKVTNAD